MTQSREQPPVDATQDDQGSEPQDDQSVVMLGKDGRPVTVITNDGSPAVAAPADEGSRDDGSDLTSLVSQPAKVMRIGSMIKQLLDEVKASPLDEASRVRLRDIHAQSIQELEDGLAPELIDELERLSLPFDEKSVPTDAELRIAQAQLVGWLEGLFHGIQTALFAQQMAARAQFEEVRRHALPPGMSETSDDAEPGPNRVSGPYL